MPEVQGTWLTRNEIVCRTPNTLDPDEVATHVVTVQHLRGAAYWLRLEAGCEEGGVLRYEPDLQVWQELEEILPPLRSTEATFSSFSEKLSVSATVDRVADLPADERIYTDVERRPHHGDPEMIYTTPHKLHIKREGT